jgi:hypothetical protein
MEREETTAAEKKRKHLAPFDDEDDAVYDTTTVWKYQQEISICILPQAHRPSHSRSTNFLPFRLELRTRV